MMAIRELTPRGLTYSASTEFDLPFGIDDEDLANYVPPVIVSSSSASSTRMHYPDQISNEMFSGSTESHQFLIRQNSSSSTARLVVMNALRKMSTLRWWLRTSDSRQHAREDIVELSGIELGLDALTDNENDFMEEEDHVLKSMERESNGNQRRMNHTMNQNSSFSCLPLSSLFRHLTFWCSKCCK